MYCTHNAQYSPTYNACPTYKHTSTDVRLHRATAKRSTVAAERQSVVPLPVGPTGTTSDLRVTVTLPKPAVLPAGSSEAAQLAMLVDSITYPVDSWVSAYGLVLRVH